MSARFAEVSRLVENLDQAELAQLGSKVAALRALGPAAVALPHKAPSSAAGPAALDSAFPDLLYEALRSALERENGVGQLDIHLFRATRGGRSYERAAAKAGQAHRSWFPKATRAETAGLCRVYAFSLISFLRARHKPLHWSVLCTELGELPEVLEHAFPGYARSGALSMLLSAGVPPALA